MEKLRRRLCSYILHGPSGPGSCLIGRAADTPKEGRDGSVDVGLPCGSLDRLAVLFLRLFRSVRKVFSLGHAAFAWYWLSQEKTRAASKAQPLRCNPKIILRCLLATAIIAFFPGDPAAFLAWYSSP